MQKQQTEFDSFAVQVFYTERIALSDLLTNLLWTKQIIFIFLCGMVLKINLLNSKFKCILTENDYSCLKGVTLINMFKRFSVLAVFVLENKSI